MKKISFFISLFLFLIAIILMARMIFSIKKSGQDKLTCENCNVILVSIDTLRADHLGCYGYLKNTSPNIDKFSKKGILFENYIVQGYLTPTSTISLFTSKYISSLNTIYLNSVLSKKDLTLTQILKAYNYTTAAFISSPEFSDFLGNAKEAMSRGFDSYILPSNFNGYGRRLPPKYQISKWLEKNKENKFFLWLPIGAVHWPYGAHSNDSVKKMFLEKEYSGIFSNKSSFDWQDSLRYIYNSTFYSKSGPIKLDESDTNYIRSFYDSGIFVTDEYFGWLLNEINKLGLNKNTTIIVNSVHGEDLGEHKYFGHYDMYDTEIKNALIIVGPKTFEKRIKAQVQGIDVMPTLLEMLKIQQPYQVQGKSLIPLIEGKVKSINEYTFSERIPVWEYILFSHILGADIFNRIDVPESLKVWNKNMMNFFKLHPNFYYNDISIRTEKWKLIYRQDPEILEKLSIWGGLTNQSIKISKLELYDIENDPYEKVNMIDKEPEIAKKLKQEIIHWKKYVNQNESVSISNIPLQEYP